MALDFGLGWTITGICLWLNVLVTWLVAVKKKKELKEGSAYFGFILQRISPSWRGDMATATRGS